MPWLLLAHCLPASLLALLLSFRSVRLHPSAVLPLAVAASAFHMQMVPLLRLHLCLVQGGSKRSVPSASVPLPGPPPRLEAERRPERAEEPQRRSDMCAQLC